MTGLLLWGYLSTAPLSAEASATTAPADRPCEDAQVIGVGETAAAGVVAVDVDRPSLLELSWDGGEAPMWLRCGEPGGGDLAVRRLGSTADALRLIVERPGTVHFSRGGDGGSDRLRVGLQAVEVKRESFWLDLDHRRLAVEHTVYLRTGPASAAGAVASYVEVLDTSGPAVRRLATAAITDGFDVRGAASRLGMEDPAVTSIVLRRTADGLRPIEIAPKNEQQTDPDPPGDGGDRMSGKDWTGRAGGAWTKNEQQTDPDPPGDGGDRMSGKDWTGRAGGAWTKNEQQTDPDPPGDGGDRMSGKDWTGRIVSPRTKAERHPDPDPPLAGAAVSWRILVASSKTGSTDPARAHLEVLGWVAPVLWPELGGTTGGGAQRRLLALDLLE